MSKNPEAPSVGARITANLAAGASSAPALGWVLAGGKDVCRLPWEVAEPVYEGDPASSLAHFDGYPGINLPWPRLLYGGVGEVEIDQKVLGAYRAPADTEPALAWTLDAGKIALACVLGAEDARIRQTGRYLMRVGAGGLDTTYGFFSRQTGRLFVPAGVVKAVGRARPKRELDGRIRY